jgi:nucleoid-associated protein YgaU
MNKLVNKSYKDYSYVCRYMPFPFYYNAENNKYIYGLTAYLRNTTVYTLHVIKQGETLDDLALEYYGNPTLYWVICSYNHIQNPYKALVAGKTIKIPSLSNIEYDKAGRS